MEERGRQLTFPEEVIPSIRRNRLAQLAKEATVAVPIAAALAVFGYGVNRLINDLDSKFHNDGIPFSTQREKGIEGLDYYYNLQGELNEQQKELLISSYLLGRDSFAGFANYEFKTNYNDESKNFVNEQRYILVLDGCSLLKKLGGKINIDPDAGTVEFRGSNFNLNNVYDQLLLDQIIQQELTLSRSEEQASTYDKFVAAQKESDLRWLSQQDLHISFTSDSFPLIIDDTLLYTARFYRFLKSQNYPLPFAINFKIYPGRGPAGYYYSGEVNVTDNSGMDAIVHESAHFQAEQNKDFSQLEFNKRVARASEDLEINSLQDMYINPGVLDKEWTNHPEVEDYAETIRTYFSDGTSFRKRLKKSELSGKPAYYVLKAKYDFAKEFFGGIEFGKLGEEFKPKSGDIFSISDPDGPSGGIYLRPEPNLDRDSSFPVVSDTDEVLIDDGPVEFKDPKTGITKKLWHVQAAYFEKSPYRYSKFGESGWISEEWLGDKLTPFPFPLYITKPD